jgi:hypothetical protein
MGRFQPFDRERRPEDQLKTFQDLAQAEMARFEEELREARMESGPMIAGIWPVVEPWYARASLGEQRVFGVVEWSPRPPGGTGTTWYAYGDLSAFTVAASDRRGLEGDLNKDPTQGWWPGGFSPMNLRIERGGDQRATAEVTLSPTGERRVVDSPYFLKSTEGGPTRIVQQEDVSSSNWTYIVLTEWEPYPDIAGAIAGAWRHGSGWPLP